MEAYAAVRAVSGIERAPKQTDARHRGEALARAPRNA